MTKREKWEFACITILSLLGSVRGTQEQGRSKVAQGLPLAVCLDLTHFVPDLPN